MNDVGDLVEPRFVAGTGVTYLVYQCESAPETGKEHIQGYMECENAKSVKAACAAIGLPHGTHMEKRKGTPAQAAQYCKKAETRLIDTDPYEEGIISAEPKQGKRTDIETVMNAVKEGMHEKEMWETFPGEMARNYKAVDRYKSLLLPEHRTWMTKGIWYWGPTGAGKSHKVFEDYDSKTHYIYEVSDNGWWDKYQGQEIVIINDFRGEIKYAQLLTLIDKWPKTVSRRGTYPIEFVAKEIRITASMPPQVCYSGVAEKESINQLIRRLEVVHMDVPAANPIVFKTTPWPGAPHAD